MIVKIMLARLAGENFFAGWILWLGFSLFFAAISCASVLYISPHSAGMIIRSTRERRISLS
jgi:hypothetical protein